MPIAAISAARSGLTPSTIIQTNSSTGATIRKPIGSASQTYATPPSRIAANAVKCPREPIQSATVNQASPDRCARTPETQSSAPATSKAGADQPRKERGADLLPGDLRKRLDVPEHGPAEKHEQCAEDGVVDLHRNTGGGM